MSALLAEQPLVVSLMLGVLGGALIYGWMQTGKKAAAIMGLIAVALIPVAWLVAGYWETDREQIETMIYTAADAVEQNDHPRVFEVIGDEDAKVRASMLLPKYRFTQANVTRIHSIDLIDGSYPQEADVEMNVVANVAGLRTVAVRLILKLHKIDGDWLVVDYRYEPISAGNARIPTMPAR